jgi:hypothetical protein
MDGAFDEWDVTADDSSSVYSVRPFSPFHATYGTAERAENTQSATSTTHVDDNEAGNYTHTGKKKKENQDMMSMHRHFYVSIF